ncbi:MAG TPA: hypothetical protein VFU47_13325, partial [Armatimonadota bacterium]|nr:hypothetical protein [Armatimonadota bacterium]
MSQDKFWEQWSAGSAEKPADKEQAATDTATSGVDADALAAWLKADSDSLVPKVPTPAPSPAANPAELAELWPPPAPVDPFAGIQGSPNTTLPEDWDLAFDEPTPGPSPAATPAGGLGDFNLAGLAGPTPAGNPFAPPDAGAPPPPAAP